MATQKSIKPQTTTFDVKKSITRARRASSKTRKRTLNVGTNKYQWDNSMDRVEIIRKGVPYEAIEVVSKKANMPVKNVLQVIGLPQTTYNKKKKEHRLLSGRDSEIILEITETLDYGIEVFNNEKEKFLRWLKKPNQSLGGSIPESLFDSITGIYEVKNSLNRIEFGNFA